MFCIFFAQCLENVQKSNEFGFGHLAHQALKIVHFITSAFHFIEHMFVCQRENDKQFHVDARNRQLHVYLCTFCQNSNVHQQTCGFEAHGFPSLNGIQEVMGSTPTVSIKPCRIKVLRGFLFSVETDVECLNSVNSRRFKRSWK